MEKQQISFMGACREFFGVHPGTTALDFGKEVKALTDEDRKEIASGLAANGFNIDPATIARKVA